MAQCFIAHHPHAATDLFKQRDKMLFPLSDENPTSKRPLVTWTLMGICVLVFGYQISLGVAANQMLISDFGVRPGVFTGETSVLTFVTSAFLHSGIFHLAFNLLFLWIFGDNIEENMGRVRFLVFYVAGGAVAALFQAVLTGGQDVPMIGASGSIAAVMGAYMVLYPDAKVNTFFCLPFGIGFEKVSAKIFIGLYIAFDVFFAVFGTDDGVAYCAHIGGFVFGYCVMANATRFHSDQESYLLLPDLERSE